MISSGKILYDQPPAYLHIVIVIIVSNLKHGALVFFQKLFEPILQVQPRPKENVIENVKVMHGGRDILNLMSTLTDPRWNYRATVLPANNPALFFANRSQYHRLGPYGTRTQYVKDSCRHCGFTWVVAATD